LREDLLEGLEKDYKNPRQFFKKCKVIRNDYKPQTPIIKNDNDDLLTEPTKIVEQFRKNFDDLLNNSRTNGSIVKYEKLIYQTAEPELTEPELKEIECIIKDLKNFKAPGEDEINPELLKIGWKRFCDRNILPSKRCMEQRMYA